MLERTKFTVEMSPSVNETFTSRPKAAQHAKTLAHKNPLKFVFISYHRDLSGEKGYYNQNGRFEKDALPWGNHIWGE